MPDKSASGKGLGATIAGQPHGRRSQPSDGEMSKVRGAAGSPCEAVDESQYAWESFGEETSLCDGMTPSEIDAVIAIVNPNGESLDDDLARWEQAIAQVKAARSATRS